MSTYLDIQSGHYRCEVSPFGGGLASLTFQGENLVAPYGDHGFPPLSAQTLLAPWPNRTADGVFAHEGIIHRLDITEPGRMTAIHGFVASEEWEVLDHGETSVRLGLRFPGQPGWPWPMRYEVTWSVEEDAGLSGVVTIALEDAAESSCPLGFGWHPYLVARGAHVDECTLTVPVSTSLPLDPQRNLPAGPESPIEGAVAGLASGVPLRGVWLDHCFGGVESPGEGMIRARLLDDGGRGVELLADARTRWFQIFTADPARREGYPGLGRALAVEPMTCPPNALRSGRDLLTLNPGEEFSFHLGIRAIGPDLPEA
ncbi:aldose 1-epimerase family protein [Corynebacterium uropygiale]|uniref:Aldose 1-epimerase family protein n=1 Tax=Corynebacterium uropygiale TaxID=1775911 RepID=A0A9X1QNW4_9CORY|nr:aldose 1-epimerase family protein [Corynebacterium uropygiale]MCF4006431.1 aldose 1-epimerase family protein [Corynebacterium uropygiale]